MNNNSQDELKRVFGTAFVTIGIAIVIYMFVSIGSNIVKDISKRNTVREVKEQYSEIEAAFYIYEELDELYSAGYYDEMYNVYNENRRSIDITGYRKAGFLECLADYYTALDNYESYLSNEYYYTSFLYYSMVMVDIGNTDKYKNLVKADKDYIDEKAAEVSDYLCEYLGLEANELAGFINQFKPEGRSRVDYSLVSDYVKKVEGK